MFESLLELSEFVFRKIVSISFQFLRCRFTNKHRGEVSAMRVKDENPEQHGILLRDLSG